MLTIGNREDRCAESAGSPLFGNLSGLGPEEGTPIS
jgi:hypothetical protein